MSYATAAFLVLSLGLLAQAWVPLPDGRGDKTGKAQDLAQAAASAPACPGKNLKEYH